MENKKIRAELIAARKNNMPVYVASDETNAMVLKDLGYQAVLTAAQVSEMLSELPGTKVIVIGKNSDGGKEEAQHIKDMVKDYAYATAVVIIVAGANSDVVDYLDKYEAEDLDRKLGNAKFDYANYIVCEKSEKDNNVIIKKIGGDRLADAIAKTLPCILIKSLSEGSEQIYLWQNGVYVKSTPVMLKKEIKKYIPSGYASDAVLKNVLSLFLCSENIPIISEAELSGDEKYINLKNGLLNVETGELEEHSPSVLSDWQLDFEYAPNGTECPAFHRYINDLCSTKEGVVDEELKARIQEYGGLLLSNINVSRVKKCLLLVSPIGNTGKSQLLKLLSLMMGAGKTANIPLQNMNEKNRFGLSQTIGTRAIICGDQTGAVVTDSSVFKMLTGGDAVRIEPKNKTPFDFYYKGGIVMACNEAPTFKDDKGNHIFDRLLVVPCEHVVNKEDADPYICDKMLQEKEAIFVWFMAGLQRLLENNFRFTDSVRADEFMMHYREKQDTLYRFIQEQEFEITNNPHDRVKKSTFNKDYVKWLQDNQLDGIAEKNICYRLEKYGVGSKKTCFGEEKGVWVYTCLKDTNGVLK